VPYRQPLKNSSSYTARVFDRVAIWPFKKPNLPNLAFMKLFASNKMAWRFGQFLAFLNVDKMVYFRVRFGQI